MLKNFEYLWTSELNTHVLVRWKGGNAVDKYIIFNTEYGTALIIEDDDIYCQVVERMKGAGVSVVDNVPLQTQQGEL